MSCLSPLLFNIFVSDLPASTDSKCIMFADDITDSAADDSLEGVARKLASSFEKTKMFCDSHGLIVNTNKTQFIVFKAINRRIPEDFSGSA